jgi:hypothetical protein
MYSLHYLAGFYYCCCNFLGSPVAASSIHPAIVPSRLSRTLQIGHMRPYATWHTSCLPICSRSLASFVVPYSLFPLPYSHFHQLSSQTLVPRSYFQHQSLSSQSIQQILNQLINQLIMQFIMQLQIILCLLFLLLASPILGDQVPNGAMDFYNKDICE